MLLPPELKFLAPLLNSPREEYKAAPWLLSDFDAPKWQYSFGYKKNPKELDWEITLSDGSSLLDSKNEELCLGFKYFLTSSTRRDLAASGSKCNSQLIMLSRLVASSCR